jgi:hypothetical protein
VGKRQREQEDEFGVLVRDWMMMAQGASVFSSMNWGVEEEDGEQVTRQEQHRDNNEGKDKAQDN